MKWRLSPCGSSLRSLSQSLSTSNGDALGETESRLAESEASVFCKHALHSRRVRRHCPEPTRWQRLRKRHGLWGATWRRVLEWAADLIS